VTTRKPLFFGLYEQANIGDGSGAASLWTHPQDRRTTSVQSYDYWLHLARIADAVHLDLMFFGDVLGIYDTYGQSPRTALEWGVELPAHDPLMIIPALAAATTSLAFGATISTSYDHPFAHARRLSTLDHMTGGRIGWNIVTSYLPSAARNFGLETMVKHDERYAIAEEFMEVAYKLWEGSWADDAYLGDKAGQRFARPDRVRAIDHRGPHFGSAGPHVSFPSPQRTPLLIQAGWSSRGKKFGARHAEIVFVGDSDPAAVRQGMQEIRDLAAEQGRDGGDIKALAGAQVIVGKTRATAEAKLADYQRYYRPEASLAAYAGWSGLDVAKYGNEEAIARASNHTQSAADKAPLLAGEIRRRYAKVDGNSALTFIGSPHDVAGQIEAYADASGIDGFLLHQFIAPGSFEDFAEFAVPALQVRGLYRTAPGSGTFRSRIRADGQDRLPDAHPGARFRWNGETPGRA
jgi:FMN-dependent oxidoreductase (nitrilotriacetate monooxygenase family)